MIEDITDRRPNHALVAMLEELLVRARAGEVRSVITVTSAADSATGHGWSLDGRTWQQPMLAELMVVQHELMLKMSLERDGGVLRNTLG